MFKQIKALTPNAKWSSNLLQYMIAVLALYSAAIGTFWLVKHASSKIAYVNSGELLKRYKGAIEANKKFDDESKKWEGNIKTLQAELDSINFLFVKEGNNWALDKKKQVAGFAKKRDEDLQRYSQAVQQKAASRQQELLTPVLADINGKISDYAKEHDYTMVFGTSEGNIVYAHNTVDITNEVLQILNR